MRESQEQQTAMYDQPDTTARWVHDTCDECGYDADVAIVDDFETGLRGWECPDCSTWVTHRDLENDN